MGYLFLLFLGFVIAMVWASWMFRPVRWIAIFLLLIISPMAFMLFLSAVKHVIG
jgi:hypothetical protein